MVNFNKYSHQGFSGWPNACNRLRPIMLRSNIEIVWPELYMGWKMDSTQLGKSRAGLSTLSSTRSNLVMKKKYS